MILFCSRDSLLVLSQAGGLFYGPMLLPYLMGASSAALTMTLIPHPTGHSLHESRRYCSGAGFCPSHHTIRL